MKPRILPAVLRLTTSEVTEFREPFAGGASVAIAMMSRRPDLRHWLNDRDYSVAALWWSVRHHPEPIIGRVLRTTPTVPLFKEFKRTLSGVVRLPERVEDLIEIGFCRLVIQYISGRSWGGGVRGGLNQRGGEYIDSRWNPEQIAQKITTVHERMARIDAKVTAYDFSRLIEDTSKRAIIYIDPPFYGYKNNYNYDMASEDHQRLADLLGTTSHQWVMSAGDHVKTRRLYRWAQIDEIGFNNLLIYPR